MEAIGESARARWVQRPEPRPDAALRLVCLPYAGGSWHAYRDWPAALPADVELCAIALPGHGGRLFERPLDELDAIVAGALAALADDLDRPYVLFGHSMGALLAYELARALRARGLPAPARLVASGLRAPHLPPLNPPIHALPEEEFVERLRALDGTPDEVLASERMRRLFLPALRADLRACELWSYSAQEPLECPISAFSGRSDPQVDDDGLLAWRVHTGAGFDVARFDGGHFFVHSERDAVLAALAERLAGDARA